MGGKHETGADWTEPEHWVWARILAGESADLNERDRETNPNCEDLLPAVAANWADDRRLSAKFLQTILTNKAFVKRTPHSGVRILGALVDDAPLDLEHARLHQLFWLEKSRVLVDIKGRNILVDGEFSLEGSFVKGEVCLTRARIRELHLTAGQYWGSINLNGARVTDGVFLSRGAIFKDKVNLGSARIGAALEMDGSTFEKHIILNGIQVKGPIFLRNSATCKAEVDLGNAKISSVLDLNGSTFEKRVNLNSIAVDGSVFLCDGGVFKGEVNLTGSKIGSGLHMKGSTFEKSVHLNSIVVNGNVFLGDGGTFHGEVDLGFAAIGLVLDMQGSTFSKRVNLNGVMVTGSVAICGGSTFKGDVNMGGAKIGSVVDLNGSVFEGRVSLNGASVYVAILRGVSRFSCEVDLRSAIISSLLDMGGSVFEQDVYLENISVHGPAFLGRGAVFMGGVSLVQAKIGSSLDFGGSCFAKWVELTGATIHGELSFGSLPHDASIWGHESTLSLRNAHCGALQDFWQTSTHNSWPETLELENFTYERLRGMHGGRADYKLLARPVDCYIEWLALDTSFSPQPYEYLANVFRQAGYPDKANSVLYASKERRRNLVSAALGDCDSWETYISTWFNWLGLGLLKWTIGYGLGHRYFRVLWWVGGFTVFGATLLYIFGVKHNINWDFQRYLFASFDQLLPVITLDKSHDNLIFGHDLGNQHICAQPYRLVIYFYAHKIAGWVLGSFLVAGLAGLTQRN